MTLREQAIQAMVDSVADEIAADEAIYEMLREDAVSFLNALLGFLRDLSSQPVHPQLDNFQRYGRLTIEALTDLLGGEQ